jgi:predicted ATP-dependent endonuclease of OLD family
MYTINPNSDSAKLKSINLLDEHKFPLFLKSIYFEKFRHLEDLKLNFIHPITVLAGTNKIGKTTILITIACSHFNFLKRNPANGKLERSTWKRMMQFTKYDEQIENWTYHIEYKKGNVVDPKRGQKKALTKKWNGVAKKETQIKDRQVVFIDLDRIFPARNYSETILSKIKIGNEVEISSKKEAIHSYLSYILERSINIGKVAHHIDKDIYRFNDSKNTFSSYNSASGEDVLTRLLIDVIEAKPKSLILIDEIEIGLHPLIQRRLIDVLNNISLKENKQFIITTHSPHILNHLDEKSRIFIEKNVRGKYKTIPKISVNAAFSKMDSKSYPLVDLFCEDSISKKIIMKIIQYIIDQNQLVSFSDLINIIECGSALETYKIFDAHKKTYEFKKIKTGFGCVLDGDQKNNFDDNAVLFLFDKSPENYLVS